MPDKQLLFSVPRSEFKLEFFRSGGKGGQKQNKTSSACRITHVPSGAVGECREERYQGINRKVAFERCCKHPKFKMYIAEKIREIDTGKSLEERVDEDMRDCNIKVEYRENDKWVDNVGLN